MILVKAWLIKFLKAQLRIERPRLNESCIFFKKRFRLKDEDHCQT